MGYVYFFLQHGTNLVKIGLTDIDPQKRFANFLTHCPYGGKMIGFIPTENSRLLESFIHKVLWDRRISKRNEWFNITESEAMDVINQMTNSAYAAKVERDNKKNKRSPVSTMILSMYKMGYKQCVIASELNTPTSYVSKIINQEKRQNT